MTIITRSTWRREPPGKVGARLGRWVVVDIALGYPAEGDAPSRWDITYRLDVPASERAAIVAAAGRVEFYQATEILKGRLPARGPDPLVPMTIQPVLDFRLEVEAIVAIWADVIAVAQPDLWAEAVAERRKDVLCQERAAGLQARIKEATADIDAEIAAILSQPGAKATRQIERDARDGDWAQQGDRVTDWIVDETSETKARLAPLRQRRKEIIAQLTDCG